MNPPRCNDLDYINFLLATPGVASAKEAARVQPAKPDAPAHDAFTRLLHRLEPDAGALWREARPFVRTDGGLLVLDDSVLDKPHARHMGLVGRFWSGTHRRVVQGINLVTLLWTDGDALWPCDYRLVDPARGKAITKNDLFRQMLSVARQRGLRPACVCFDSWYSGKDNLKAVRGPGWTFLAPVRCDRRVNLDRRGNRAIQELPIAAGGAVVHLEGLGLVKAFRIVARNGPTEHRVTNDLRMDELQRQALAGQAWGIEEYHRGPKRHCGAEAAQARHKQAQANHVGCAIRAFLRLEHHRFTTGVSWFEAKMEVLREALRRYLACPLLVLPQPSTA